METTREEIIRATIRGVRLYGLDGLRVRHTGFPAGEVYDLFEGKEDLLAQCFEYVERQLGKVFSQLKVTEEEIIADAKGAARRIWTAYFHWLMDNPDETIFYRCYRESKEFIRYDRDHDYSYYDGFLQLAEWFDKHCKLYTNVSRRSMWYYLFTGTASYAKAIIEGRLAPEDAPPEQIFNLLMGGISGVVGD